MSLRTFLARLTGGARRRSGAQDNAPASLVAAVEEHYELAVASPQRASAHAPEEATPSADETALEQPSVAVELISPATDEARLVSTPEPPLPTEPAALEALCVADEPTPSCAMREECQAAPLAPSTPEVMLAEATEALASAGDEVRGCEPATPAANAPPREDASNDIGDPFDLGSDPSDPLLLDLVMRNVCSVRLANALRIAAARGELPFHRLSAYRLLGEDAPALLMQRVENLGRKSVGELETLLARAEREMAAAPTAAEPASEDLDLRTRLAELIGHGPVAEALVQSDVPPRLWNALANQGLLQASLSEVVLTYAEREAELLRMPNFGRTSYRAGREALETELRRRFEDFGLAPPLAQTATVVVLEDRVPSPAETVALSEILQLAQPAAAEAPSQAGPSSVALSRPDLRSALVAHFDNVSLEPAVAEHQAPARLVNGLDRVGYLQSPVSALLSDLDAAQRALAGLENFGARSQRALRDTLAAIVRAELARAGLSAEQVVIAEQFLLDRDEPAADALVDLARSLTPVAGPAPAEPDQAPVVERMAKPVEPPRGLLQVVLAELPDREREVLERRYGLYGAAETLEEVGQTFRVTRERIRQIEKKALRRVRDRIGRQLTRSVVLHGAPAWAELAAGEDLLLASEVSRTDRRLSPWFLLALEAQGLDVHGWLDTYAQAHGDVWAPKDLDLAAFEACTAELQQALRARPLPCALSALVSPERALHAQVAIRRLGRRMFGGYVLGDNAGRRMRRALRLHSLLGRGGLQGLPELMGAYWARVADDPCSTRDAEIVMQAYRHLFAETVEGCWAAVGETASVPLRLESGPAGEELEDVADDEVAAQDGTIGAAIEAELRAIGPSRISELLDRAPRFLPAGRSTNSVGPILLMNKDRFARPLPGFYALPSQLPTPEQLLARPPAFMLQEDQVRIFVLARRAGEPRESFPLWSVEAECAWARWARQHAEPELLESFLAVADMEAWPQAMPDRADWLALRSARARFSLGSPPLLDGVERPDLDRLFTACLHARRHGAIGWISANRILWRRVHDYAAAGVLAAMVVTQLLEPADDWQAPHRAGPALEAWIARLDEVLARTGALRWDDELGQALLQTARAERLGWVPPEFADRLLGSASPEPPTQQAQAHDPLQQLLAERAQARRDVDLEAALRRAATRAGGQGA